MRKVILLAVVLIAILAGCTTKPAEETPVEAVDPSVASFEALSESVEWTVDGNYFITVAPDQSVSLSIAQSYTSENDVVMCVDAAPFIAAGLDVTKLPEGLYVDGRLNYVTSIEGNTTYTNVTEAFTDILNIQADLVGYHAALDHYGLSLQDGNVFEWAADVNTNDKDIVFVLNPQTLIDAGVNVEAIDAWIFAEVEIMQADGSMKMVPKLLKPFDLN